jgi:phosphotransferase system enzyme I (PtsP)
MHAADRGNSRVNDRFDQIGPPILRAFQAVSDAAKAARKPVSVCGELASRPLGALALIGTGYDILSVAPSAIGPLKALLRQITMSEIQDTVSAMMNGDLAARQKLQDLASLADQS